jgi:hypothetical protein
MGIVARARWRLTLGLGWHLCAEGGLFGRAAGARVLCVAIALISGSVRGGIPSW